MPAFARRNSAAGLATVILLAAGSARSDDRAHWAASYDPATRTRFIPVELWTGTEWDGRRDLRMTPADTVGGKRADRRIRGPVPWTRPGASEPIHVYERMDGRGVEQLFTLSSRGDGLGRVYDSRYSRDCIDEVKFPLGVWKEGEARTFRIPCDYGSSHRTIRLTIEKLDFTFEGVPHSLQYHWLVDGGRRPGTNMHYVYSPGRGLATVDED
jgi:hypothetical protein